MAQQKPPNVLIIGNPGVGKSTLLNGIVGEAKFQAGMSLDGGGVTKILQQCLHDGVNYVDTPGLDDDFSRRECAAEIEKALKLGGLFFICFVITLESGRIRPNDKSTIRLVLDAAKQIGGQYSVIVNKLETKICDAFQKDPNRFKGILSRGFPDNIITNSLHFFPHSDGLFNSDNAVFEPESVQGFLDFLKDAPGVVIDPPKVDKVKDEEWEVKFAEYEKVIKELYDQMAKNEAAFKATLEEERKRLNQQLVVVQEQQRQMAAAHKAEMDRVKQQVAEAQRQQIEAQRKAAEAERVHAESVARLNAQAAQQKRELEELKNRPPPPPIVHHHGGGGCCFPSNAICVLEDGTRSKISDIKEGQKVLAVDDKGNLIVSEAFYVDGNEDKNTMVRMFYQDHNQTEASLTATPEHLIYASRENCSVEDYIKKERPKIANNVEIGDFLFINNNGNIEPRQVTRIVREEVDGRWAVLTLHHRLLVDNVLVSAYEIDERWGIFDNQSVILLYHLFPSFVASDGFKKFCRGWDDFFDPVIKTMRELF